MQKTFPFVAVPHFYFSLFPFLTESANKIYLIILRKTLGWNKEWAFISRSEFMHLTGLSDFSVKQGMRFLKDHFLIEIKLKGQNRGYKIAILNQTDTGEIFSPWQFGTREKISLVASAIREKISQKQGRKSPPLFSCKPMDIMDSTGLKKIKEKEYKEMGEKFYKQLKRHYNQVLANWVLDKDQYESEKRRLESELRKFEEIEK